MLIHDCSDEDGLCLFTEDQEWTPESCAELLLNHNIVYDGNGVVACNVINRSGDQSALINFMIEDDGFLHETNISFDLLFIDDLIKNLQSTKRYCIDNGMYSEYYAKRKGLKNKQHEQNEQQEST